MSAVQPQSDKTEATVGPKQEQTEPNKRVRYAKRRLFLQKSEDNGALPEKKKKSSTTYFAPDGKENSFIQAREHRLDLDRDLGKMKVLLYVPSPNRSSQITRRRVKQEDIGVMYVNAA